MLTRGAIAIAIAYSGYALVYVASANVKSEDIQAQYSAIHPLLRVAASSLILVDPSAVITDAGLPHLKRLTSLETLCLDETRVSDEGLSNIRGLVALEVLHLRSRLPVTDRSIPLIIRFVKLRELKVDGTKITPEGLERLKRKLPDCRIE